MTLEERIIATAYTGISFISGDEMDEFYKYAEEKLGHAVFDIVLTFEDFWSDLKVASTEDFLKMTKPK